jgi:hypothetical protein
MPTSMGSLDALPFAARACDAAVAVVMGNDR